jgi:hypothetical protein
MTMGRSAAATVDTEEMLRNRIENSIDKVIRTIPKEALTAALESPGLTEFFAQLVWGLPALDEEEEEELRRQRLHAVRFKHEMAEAAGGLLDADVVSTMLGYTSRQALHKAIKERRLLAVKDAGRQRFPACQFDGNSVFSGVQQILKAAPNTNGWRILQYLFGRDEGLNGDRPIDLIKGSSEDIQRAIRVARTLED